MTSVLQERRTMVAEQYAEVETEIRAWERKDTDHRNERNRLNSRREELAKRLRDTVGANISMRVYPVGSQAVVVEWKGVDHEPTVCVLQMEADSK